MNYITKTEAFAHHGATLTAPRGVWAKKSDDGKLVVLAAWRKGFNRDPFLPGKASYTFGDGSPNPTSNRGRKEFIELMNWAIENCEGMIKAVVSEAQDWDHHPHDFVGGVPLLGKRSNRRLRAGGLLLPHGQGDRLPRRGEAELRRADRRPKLEKSTSIGT